MVTSFHGLYYKVVTSGVDREISTACCQSSSSDECQNCNLRISIIFLSALRCLKASFLQGSYLFLICGTQRILHGLIFIINAADQTKLSCNISQRRSTTVFFQTYTIFRTTLAQTIRLHDQVFHLVSNHSPCVKMLV